MTFLFNGFAVASFFAPVLRNVSCEHHTIEIHIQNKCYDFFFSPLSFMSSASSGLVPLCIVNNGEPLNSAMCFCFVFSYGFTICNFNMFNGTIARCLTMRKRSVENRCWVKNRINTENRFWLCLMV